MNRLPLRPFNHFKQNKEHFCPKCGTQDNHFRRVICKGKMVLWSKKCPESDHFHHKCEYCKGEWCEATRESEASEMQEMLGHVFDMCDNNAIGESDIVNFYRLRKIEEVMKGT